MTMGKVGESAMQSFAEGWHALRDKAHNALTHFRHDDDDEEAGGDAAEVAQPSQRWGLVATDLVEHDDHIELRMEIPGMEKSDLRVDISGGQLSVSGEKQTGGTRREGSAVITERAFGHFRRVLPLPAEVDAQNATAKYVNGVLEIELPKQPNARTQSIDVG